MRPRTRRQLCKLRNTIVSLAILAFLWKLLLAQLSWFKASEPLRTSPLSILTRETPAVIVDVRTCKTSLFNWCKLPDDTWQQHEKDLYLGSSWFGKKYIQYKHIPSTLLTAQDEVVVKLAAQSPTYEEQIYYDSKTEKLSNSELLASRGWFLVDKKAQLWVKKARFVDLESSVTAIKLLFGPEIRYPVPKWHACSYPLKEGRDKYSMPSLFYRVGERATIAKPKLEFDLNGKMRIAQVSDLHMTTGPGQCRQVAPPYGEDEEGNCLADTLTAEFIFGALDTEKPDLVVYSGDMIHGEGSPDPETALLKAVLPAIDHQIPFTAIWGNHDGSVVPNFVLTSIMMELPYCLMEHGPEEIYGDGNYVLTASPANEPDIPALSLYLMDTHSRSNIAPRAYDWVHKDQVEYFADRGTAIASKLANWDGHKLSMAFLHIPTSYFLISVKQLRVGDMREYPTVAAKDEGIMNALMRAGVSIFLAGHDHVNDFCQFLHKNPDFKIDRDMYVCYAGAAGYAGYGREPDEEYEEVYKRRIRFFDVDIKAGNIATYHRLDRDIGHTRRFNLVENGITVVPGEITDAMAVRPGASVVFSGFENGLADESVNPEDVPDVWGPVENLKDKALLEDIAADIIAGGPKGL